MPLKTEIKKSIAFRATTDLVILLKEKKSSRQVTEKLNDNPSLSVN